MDSIGRDRVLGVEEFEVKTLNPALFNLETSNESWYYNNNIFSEFNAFNSSFEEQEDTYFDEIVEEFIDD